MILKATTYRFTTRSAASVILFLLFASVSFTQNNNVLESNSSPVFILMGISPTEIANPTDLGDFTTSIQNSTDNFNTLPSSYAIEIYPHKIFNSEFKYVKNQSSLFKNLYKRTSISVGYNAENIVPTTGQNYSRLGFGFKTSLINDKTQKKLTKSDIKKIKANKNIGMLAAAIPANVDQSLLNDPNSAFILNTLDIAPSLDRTGGFLDLAFAFAYDFTGVNADQMDFSQMGVWLTGGYSSKSNKDEISFDVLLTTRLINYSETQYFTEESMTGTNLQVGGKFNLNALAGDFQLSAEWIYQDGITNTDKYLFNTSYEIKDNVKLGLTLGKDFDNTRTREGNLISFVNFISSFGTRD